MSASTTPTLWPEAASAAARLTVTEDFPTPPLPLATAYTRVSDDGCANGITGSGRPPRSWPCSAFRCSSLITSSATRTPETPGSAATASVTLLVMVSRIGQPATVRYTPTCTSPPSAISTDFTMPSSVMGRPISGSLTPPSAAVTCSAVGSGEFMPSCYVPGGTRLIPRAPRHHVRQWRQWLPLGDGLARHRVEDERLAVLRVLQGGVGGEELEHLVDAAGDAVENARDALTVQPVVLDELGDRRLAGQRVRNEVALRPRRDEQQRQPRAVAATAVLAGQRGAGAAHAGAGQRVGDRGGRVGDPGERVVVPAVGVVVGDDHRGALPVRGLLQRVDRLHDELLRVERVGVEGVLVLEAGGLQEADRGQRRRRQPALVDGGHELVPVGRVVLVVRRVELRHAVDVGLSVLADRGQPGEGVLPVAAGRDRQVVWVGRRDVVLEWLVVRDVVVLPAVLAGARGERAGQPRADGGDGVADPLVGGGLLIEQPAELVGDEDRRRLPGLADRG